jgi:hypothetical protein
MKMRFLCALIGLAISFAVPAFAQQKDTVDPKIAEQLSALSKKTVAVGNEVFSDNR